MVASEAEFRQAHAFVSDPSRVSSKAEDQWFDRKGMRVSPEGLANLLIGFANADGGTILVGVTDDGTIEDIKSDPTHVNKLRQAAANFSRPTVKHAVVEMPCPRSDGSAGNVLAFEVPPSDTVHRNHREETYLRVGDENRKLSFEAAQELHFDKGQSVFDRMPIPGTSIADFTPDLVERLTTQLSSTADPTTILKARGALIEVDGRLNATNAGMLLFGSNPQMHFPNALIRVLRYDGITAESGTRQNLTLDERIDGPLPEQIARADELISSILPKVIRLDAQEGKFGSFTVIPRDVWLEALVNAVTHRSYSNQGDHVRVRVFDDRIVVESPGRLPGSVNIHNIRHTRFSRNPLISRVLTDLNLVQELNEGMDRMFRVMDLAGLRAPVLEATEAGFKVMLPTERRAGPKDGGFESGSNLERGLKIRTLILAELDATGRASVSSLAQSTGLSAPAVRRHLKRLADEGEIVRVARSANDPTGYWERPRRR